MRCAAPTCSATRPRIAEVDPTTIGMPAEVVERAPTTTPVRCSYCGFVWFPSFDSRTSKSVVIPAGFYDAPNMEQGFVAVLSTHRVRQP
jgi:hypothetical protein